jgi:PAP2 superfamily
MGVLTMVDRRRFTGGLAALALAGGRAEAAPAENILLTWYKLALELVRHTPTYSPPVASRALAYLGITVFEAAASGSSTLRTLAGQLNGLTPSPQRNPGNAYDEGVVIQAALALAVQTLFENTGPTGQRAMERLQAKLGKDAATRVSADVTERSVGHGRAVAQHILDWSRGDGGATIDNLGFPAEFALAKGPGRWVPTNLVALQQMPLLPEWGKNRSFAMPDGASCPLPPPPEYSEDKGSAFYAQALEVFEVRKALTPEQRAVAKFWSDDAMLTPTPPGHWTSIAVQILAREHADLAVSAEVLARLGVAMADAFIVCWRTKFEYDLLRPITYIRRTMDPKWEPLLNTPPFPEYPSGHSAQSAAAATVLTSFFGEAFAFEDATHSRDGLQPRKFASFWAAANEAAISRLYGGIHFRAAIERGLEQGRCAGAFAAQLRTRA